MGFGSKNMAAKTKIDKIEAAFESTVFGAMGFGNQIGQWLIHRTFQGVFRFPKPFLKAQKQTGEFYGSRGGNSFWPSCNGTMWQPTGFQATNRSFWSSQMVNPKLKTGFPMVGMINLWNKPSTTKLKWFAFRILHEGFWKKRGLNEPKKQVVTAPERVQTPPMASGDSLLAARNPRGLAVGIRHTPHIGSQFA